MTLEHAIESLKQFGDWTDAQRIQVLIETMDELNNGDALEFLDHWIAHARPLLVRNSSSVLDPSPNQP
jgi:hypothetical protein